MNSRFILTDHITPQEYLNMRKAVGWRLFAPEEAEEGLKHSCVWCIRDQGRPAALGRVIWDHGYVMYVADIIVIPEYQGQGLGREIMEQITAFARSQLKPGYRIMVSRLAAKGKEQFYEKFGFVTRPNETVGPGMHQWLEAEPSSGESAPCHSVQTP